MSTFSAGGMGAWSQVSSLNQVQAGGPSVTDPKAFLFSRMTPEEQQAELAREQVTPFSADRKMTSEQMEQAQADEAAREEKRASSTVPVVNPFTNQAGFMPPSDPPPPFSTSAPVYIKDVSMKDTSQYNRDAPLLAACKAKGISPYFASQLQRLREYSAISIILDDSGSMKAQMSVPGERPRTRWDLLQEMVKEIFDLITITRGADEPVDVYFLNMLPMGMKASSYQSLVPFFQRQPSGTTPTLAVLQQNIMTPENMVKEEGVLTILITDGAPDCGHALFRSFLLETQRRFVASYVTIGLCTDDQATIDEYEGHLDSVPHTDIMSAYSAERNEIRRIQGARFPFSRLDYTAKFLLGSRVTEWDSLDEKKLSKDQLRSIRAFGEGYLGGAGGSSTNGSGRDGGKDKKCVIM